MEEEEEEEKEDKKEVDEEEEEEEGVGRMKRRKDHLSNVKFWLRVVDTSHAFS